MGCIFEGRSANVFVLDGEEKKYQILTTPTYAKVRRKEKKTYILETISGTNSLLQLVNIYRFSSQPPE